MDQNRSDSSAHQSLQYKCTFIFQQVFFLPAITKAVKLGKHGTVLVHKHPKAAMHKWETASKEAAAAAATLPFPRSPSLPLKCHARTPLPLIPQVEAFMGSRESPHTSHDMARSFLNRSILFFIFIHCKTMLTITRLQLHHLLFPCSTNPKTGSPLLSPQTHVLFSHPHPMEFREPMQLRCFQFTS